MSSINKKPLPFLALALLALLAALWAGLLRLGWSIPPLIENLAILHGPLMISGFLGTLITLERVVALRRPWMYIAPLLTGLGWLTTLLFTSPYLGPLLFGLGSLGGVVILVVIVRRDPGLHAVVMLVGMISWAAGNFLWLNGRGTFEVVYWWQSFLVLTILGERLELNRVLRPLKMDVWIFALLTALLTLGPMVMSWAPRAGTMLIGAALVGLSLWSIPNDIAWRNLRHKIPLTRYIAWCLALGFIWLSISGILNIIYGPQYAGQYYDAMLHGVFVGFVISMIFGHAPIIFPAVLGAPINFHPSFYVQLALLHISLVLRIIGDLSGWGALRQSGGLMNVVAIMLFLATTIHMLRKSLIVKSKS